MVCLVDDEKLLSTVTGQVLLGGAQQLGRSARLGDVGVGQQGTECAERDDSLGRGAHHPVHEGGRDGERLRGAVSQQRLADAVGSQDRHAGRVRIGQSGRDVAQQCVLRRGNPSTRHRRILWPAPLTACG